jgi:hypothetical protein
LFYSIIIVTKLSAYYVEIGTTTGLVGAVIGWTTALVGLTYGTLTGFIG